MCPSSPLSLRLPSGITKDNRKAPLALSQLPVRAFEFRQISKPLFPSLGARVSSWMEAAAGTCTKRGTLVGCATVSRLGRVFVFLSFPPPNNERCVPFHNPEEPPAFPCLASPSRSLHTGARLGQVLLYAQQGLEGLDLPAVSDAFWFNFGQIDVPEVRESCVCDDWGGA